MLRRGYRSSRAAGFAVIGSERSTNEDLYIAQKFARTVMGTNSVDVASNVRPELFPPLEAMLGYRAATNSIGDLEGSKCFLVVSSNITEEQNVAAVPIKKAVKEGAKLIVIDQRETELTRFADVWLRPRPGSEAALIGGMLRVIVDESLDDHRFLAEKCDGVQEFKNSLWNFDLLQVERATGLSREDVQAAARLLATNGPASVLYGLETVEPELRGDCVAALVNLCLASGNMSRPSAGLYPLYQGANEQGARDMGAVPDALPGYASIRDNEARGEFEDVWETAVPAGDGASVRELAAGDRVGPDTGADAARQQPELHEWRAWRIRRGAGQARFSGSVRLVHERDHRVGGRGDSFGDVGGDVRDGDEPRTQGADHLAGARRQGRGRGPTGGRSAASRGRWARSGLTTPDAGEVFDEINNVVEVYGGITYDRLASGGLQWPCLAADMSDTQVLYDYDEHRPQARADDHAGGLWKRPPRRRSSRWFWQGAACCTMPRRR